jgi:hypothetical protein
MDATGGVDGWMRWRDDRTGGALNAAAREKKYKSEKRGKKTSGGGGAKREDSDESFLSLASMAEVEREKGGAGKDRRVAVNYLSELSLTC